VALALQLLWAGSLAGMAGAVLLAPGQARAQSQEGAATRSYDIPAGPLEATLNRLGREAGVLITFGPAVTDGQRSQGVRGSHTPRQALDEALRGTGLMAVPAAGGGYALRAMPAVAPAAPAATGATHTLRTVTVTAAAQASARTEGSASYTTPATAAATGLSLALRDTPQSVSVVTRQQMDDQGLLSLNDAMRNVTGIHVVSSDSDRFDFYSRGFYVDNLQYDGVPTSIGLSFYGESGNDTTIYDRVEVVRGATGLLTGAGNPSASINLVRKHADSKVFTGTVSASVGSWGQHRGALDLSMPLTSDGRIRARIAGMAEERDSHVDLYHARKRVFYGVIDADLTPDTTLSVGADYQSNRPTGSTWGGLPLMFADGTPADWDTSKTTAARWTRWNSTNQTLFANLQHRFDNGWKLKAHAVHRVSDYDAKLLYLMRQPDATTGLGMTALPNYSEYSFQQNSADLQLTGGWDLGGRRHEAVLGLSSSRAREHKAGHARLSPLQPVGNFLTWDGSYAEPTWGPLTTSSLDHTRQDAVYGALRLSLADPLKLIVGGRQSSWKVRSLSEVRSHDVFIPYAGLVLDLNDTFSAYASYTDIFQPQNYRDRNGSYLDPVAGKSLEIGIKGEHLDGRLNSALSVFRIQQDNVAQLDQGQVVPGTTDFAYRGARGVTSKGVEAQVSGELATGWSLSAGISHTVARDADGLAINTWAPKTQVQLFTAYRLAGAWSGLTVGGGLQWQGPTRATVTVGDDDLVFRQKSFGTVSLMARYAFTPRLSLQLNLNNLFDKKYYVNIDGQGQFGTPRSAVAMLSYKF
jgi:outer membrane receptor for ferric coprogen and ferric-rhodotorulic acid